MRAINLQEKFSKITEYWTPKIIAESNGHYVKITKVKGEFVWHDHKNEDELFIIIKGKLLLHFRDRVVEMNPGEIYVIPRGEEHKPVAEEETHILYIEPKETKHTGEVASDLTVKSSEMEWI